MDELVVIDSSKLSAEVLSKYTLENNALKTVAKDNPKDLVEAIIGDDKQLDFMPQVKIQRWDNECNVSIRLVDDELTKPTITTVKDKIVWTNVEKDIKFYDLPISEEHPEGAYEFEIILKEKPKTNRIEFTLNTKGLDFYYQSELTQEEKDRGDVRPENVVGSYAVYASENKVNYVGGKEYKCGKVGHIFRPKVVDAKGTEVWGELNVDAAQGILSVAIPQDFLDKAVYPVRHAAGFTFGFTGTGATESSIGVNYASFVNGTPADGDGTVQTVSMYGRDASGSTAVKAVIWLKSNNTIIAAGVGGTVSINSSVAQWWNMTYSTEPTVTNGEVYQVGFIPNNTASAYRDSHASQTPPLGGYDLNSYTTPTSLSSPYGNSTYKYSIYATYTAGGGATTSIKSLIEEDSIIVVPR